MLDRVTVRVPATTANLGPGFDCLGIALDIYNTATIEKSQSPSIAITGEGGEFLCNPANNRMYRAVVTFYEKIGQAMPNLAIRCHNDIPLARGLGSSAAAVIGGLVGANLLCGEPLSPDELLELGTALEGHPDNVTPALLGGCQVAILDRGKVIHARIPLAASFKAVLFIPEFGMPTEETRRLLPQQVSQSDAVHNIGRVALLVTALATGQLHYLRVATQDRLHQPWRQTLFPAMESLFQAALSAGAVGAFLSGGGSAILAISEDNGDEVAGAMLEAAAKAGVKGQVRIAQPNPVGAQAIEA